MSTFFVSHIHRAQQGAAVTSPRALRAGAALCLAAFITTAGTTFGARANAPADSKPILMSRTGGAGGGDSWADVKELQAAADKGNPNAQAQLGEMLLRGEGIAKNEARGVEFLERAARAGHSAASFRLGMLLMNGESGVAQDQPRALAYFRAAAAGGEKEAFFNIGAAYGSAKGVKRDYGEALGWLIVARQHGADASAEKQLRERIKAQPAWIAKGERRAKEIAQEFSGKKVADLLPPPAPFDTPAVAPTGDLRPTSNPSAATAPRADPRPASTLPRPEPPKPALPKLPPPTINP